MKINEYYDKKYYGLEHSFAGLLDFCTIKHWLCSDVLDVGCGQGENVKKLMSMGFNSYGCDVFNDVKKLGKNFFYHDFQEKPFFRKFNTIVSIHVLEHLFDYISFLKNIRKSLKSNGVFILAVPNAYSITSRIKFLLGNEKITFGVGELNCVEKNKLEPHLRFFGKNTLNKVLVNNGFKVLDLFTTNSKSIRVPFGGQLIAVSTIEKEKTKEA